MTETMTDTAIPPADRRMKIPLRRKTQTSAMMTIMTSGPARDCQRGAGFPPGSFWGFSRRTAACGSTIWSARGDLE